MSNLTNAAMKAVITGTETTVVGSFLDQHDHSADCPGELCKRYDHVGAGHST